MLSDDTPITLPAQTMTAGALKALLAKADQPIEGQWYGLKHSGGKYCWRNGKWTQPDFPHLNQEVLNQWFAGGWLVAIEPNLITPKVGMLLRERSTGDVMRIEGPISRIWHRVIPWHSQPNLFDPSRLTTDKFDVLESVILQGVQ